MRTGPDLLALDLDLPIHNILPFGAATGPRQHQLLCTMWCQQATDIQGRVQPETQTPTKTLPGFMEKLNSQYTKDLG